ncbi:YcnI family protein [Streptomyces qinzhouensis]|uniref:YcnI family protein n=1 Tax=Streptomyces qinzhouensis TaxID=2599401 RepID=A0A5B8IGT7_9ACTN|nr:YcnI family protein [Streptomyces qinzhouensis]QDY77768.1 YcnI family protein [Streptomyces qinzhouensis]
MSVFSGSSASAPSVAGSVAEPAARPADGPAAGSRKRRRTARTVALLTASGAASLLLAGPAFAHISVQPQGEAARGGYATVGVKVPNERDNASTVKLELTLPTEHPLASVLPQPVPGWNIEVTKAKLAKPLSVHGKQITEAVSKVTWTAAGSKIGPGQFQQFPLSIGQLPENADRLVFKALQTYDNKEVVRWIETPEKGKPEPESPAPVLTLSAGTDGHGAPAANDAKGHHGGTGDTPASGSPDTDSSDTFARTLGVIGILVGAAGIAFGVFAGRRHGGGRTDSGISS